MARLYVDHGVALVVTTMLVNAGHDVLTPRNIGLKAAGDELHLLTATQLGRILVVHDADYYLLHRAWHLWSAEWGVSPQHPGILVAPQPPVRSPVEGGQAVLDILARSVVFANQLWQWTDHGWLHYPNP